MKVLLLAAALLTLPAVASAATCEESFRKSVNPLTGSQYSAAVTIEGLSRPSAMAQMRGVAQKNGLAVLVDEPEAGSLLLEDPETFQHKAIPIVVSATEAGRATTVEMVIRTGSGAFAKTAAMRAAICGMLADLKPGRTAQASAAAPAKPVRMQAFALSQQVSREERENAAVIPLRHRGRAYTLIGVVDYVIKDGDAYRVAFDVQPKTELLGPLPGIVGLPVGISCLMGPGQTAYALALRKTDKVTLTGVFHQYDEFRRHMWLTGCRPG